MKSYEYIEFSLFLQSGRLLIVPSEYGHTNQIEKKHLKHLFCTNYQRNQRETLRIATIPVPRELYNTRNNKDVATESHYPFKFFVGSSFHNK